ncbi:MAG: hypothetical protein EOP04_25865 [Proteobacteria bacterium]|nr:MAG: hypothetical protein EOP04_25865 [Pseudomonadota bacterium]
MYEICDKNLLKFGFIRLLIEAIVTHNPDMFKVSPQVSSQHLSPEEMEFASALWKNLRFFVPGAYGQLASAPEHIRIAIIQALIASIEKWNANTEAWNLQGDYFESEPDNPFFEGSITTRSI